MVQFKKLWRKVHKFVIDDLVTFCNVLCILYCTALCSDMGHSSSNIRLRFKLLYQSQTERVLNITYCKRQSTSVSKLSRFSLFLTLRWFEPEQTVLMAFTLHIIRMTLDLIISYHCFCLLTPDNCWTIETEIDLTKE